MAGFLNRTLLALSLLVVAVDVVWAESGHFSIDVRGYSLLLFLIPPIVAGCVYYNRLRNEPAIGAMLAGIAFLIVFPSACCLLSYLMLTVAGSPVDDLLAGIDRAMGFSWPAVMTFASNHLLMTHFLRLIYLSVIPQTAVLLLLFGWRKKTDQIYGMCLALAFSAILTILIWAAFPAFGAFAVFRLSPEINSKLGLALNGEYGQQLLGMLKNGPGFISPKEMRGIIGFPSYHTVQALVLMWYARSLPYIRWAALALNLLVLVSIPIHGGHHLIDMFGGAAVTFLCIILSDWIVAFSRKRECSETFSSLPQTVPPRL